MIKEAVLVSNPAVDITTPCEDCAVRDRAVCSLLPQDAHDDLQQFNHHRLLKAGETLFEEGDERRFVYSVVSGAVRLTKTLPDGRRHIAGFVLPGDFIGLSEGLRHHLDAEAISATELCVFNKESMDQFMLLHPQVQTQILEMARRALRMAYETHLVLGRFSPVEKIAYFILDIGQRLNRQKNHGVLIELPMNRTDIADYLGLTIETVSRSFSKLKAQGLIQLPNTTSVKIVDRAALMQMAAYQDE